MPTELLPEGVLANVIGWGYPTLDAQSRVVPSELMKINMNIHRADTCNKELRKVRDNNILNNQICTLGGTGVFSWMVS